MRRPTATLTATIALLASLQLAAQREPAKADAPGVLTVPKGTVLDPAASYSIRVTIGSRSISGTFRPSPGGAPTTASVEAKSSVEQAPSGRSGGAGGGPSAGPAPNSDLNPTARSAIPPSIIWLWVILAAAGAAALCAATLWYYFRRLVPRREAEPYLRATEALREGRFEAALVDLTQVETRLPPEQRAAARFFIALCHFHLDDEPEAERLLSILHRENPGDVEAAYVLAYLRVKLGRDTDAERVLESMRRDGQLGYRDATWLMSIVKFRLGMAAYEAGQIETAAELFTDVARLGLLAAHIPGDLRNRHIVLGTRALFDRDLAVARVHFEALAAVARETTGDDGKALQARAALGLALAGWIEDDPSQADRLATSLDDACVAFHPDGPMELPWPAPEPGSAKGDAEALKRALEAADRHFNLPPERKEILRCLRDLHLLRAVVVLRSWNRMEGAAAHSAIPVRLQAVMSRLACARAIDERFSDVYLIAGLLYVYLHELGPERSIGVELLLEARKLGMRDPDATAIVNARERIERENAGAVDKYEEMLDRYLRDETVRREVRQDLLNRLSTHRSLMNRYRPPDLARAQAVPPTVDEMRTRSAALFTHIERIRQASANAELQQLSSDLQRHSEELSAQAAAIERTEADLIALTGDELFRDE
jgi:hypothetical protein